MAYPQRNRWLVLPDGPQLNFNDPLTIGLVGYWPLGIQSLSGTTPDLSMRPSNGVLYNAPTLTNAGYLGKSFTFNGTNQYIKAPTSAYIDNTNTFQRLTIAAWCKTTTDNDQQLIARSSPGAEGWELRLTRDDASKRFDFATVDSGGGLQQLHSVTTVTACIGLWTFICGTLGGATKVIYINGRPENSAATPGLSVNIAGNPIGLGADVVNGGQYFGGMIGPCMVWDRALSAFEVMRLYREPFAMLAPPSRRWFTATAAAPATVLTRRTMSRLGARVGTRSSW